MLVSASDAEPARALLIERFADGFEEQDGDDGAVVLSVYTDAAGEQRLRALFAHTRVAAVASGWEERWRDFHRPVRVGSLWIGPPWERAPADATRVVIDPGRAFGTGAHPTTRLSLELLLMLPAHRGKLLDVGCGSGVLAIAAAKLGFDEVLAIDTDPAAVEATTANAARNGVDVRVWSADATRARLPAADVVLANIGRREASALGARVVCDFLLTSGYLADDDPHMPRARRLERRTDEGWAADLYTLRAGRANIGTVS